MADPMRIRAQMAGDKVEVRVLMSHEMETGQRRDGAGNLVPAWFIQNVTVNHGARTVMSAQWGPAVAKNPFIHFRFTGGKVGERISVTWTDSRGEKRTDEVAIIAA